MEKLYCTIFVVDISQNPEEVETVSSRIQQLIEDHGGIIKKINRWGKRRLAYPIQKKTHGYYVEIEFTANSRLNIPYTLEQEYRMNDRVLRYLTYVVDKKELIQRAKKAGEKAKVEAKAAEAKAAAEAEAKAKATEEEKKAETAPAEAPATASTEETAGKSQADNGQKATEEAAPVAETKEASAEVAEEKPSTDVKEEKEEK
ncbi:MAG: 30S ribosomal protein S6 [Calditrichaeota bacterium]|nr:30S ribosomal protein S6 [Calditrichota bacterium]